MHYFVPRLAVVSEEPSLAVPGNTQSTLSGVKCVCMRCPHACLCPRGAGAQVKRHCCLGRDKCVFPQSLVAVLLTGPALGGTARGRELPGLV
ncbi:hypothetical protein NDU88_004804 [Pleurodeles waltl]|uniref:Uncharacterized protein n=1 Tax=Pleurodeles waltl TaxID=8319 RepID=A0AAV7RHW5_PLEWA|nr:hypothetical protein NDU88_004804 [Pleurodeles waltl]